MMEGKEKFHPSWEKFLLPPGSFHGDPLCLKDRASVEPLHTNYHQKKVGGPSFHMGLDIKRLVMGVFVCKTGCNRLSLFRVYPSCEAWPRRA
jgi:hypothetical protein